jgi:hypothetical protein
MQISWSHIDDLIDVKYIRSLPHHEQIDQVGGPGLNLLSTGLSAFAATSMDARWFSACSLSLNHVPFRPPALPLHFDLGITANAPHICNALRSNLHQCLQSTSTTSEFANT